MNKKRQKNIWKKCMKLYDIHYTVEIKLLWEAHMQLATVPVL